MLGHVDHGEPHEERVAQHDQAPVPERLAQVERAQQREGRVQRRHGRRQVIADVQHLGVAMAVLPHKHLVVEGVEQVPDQRNGVEVVAVGIIRVGRHPRGNGRIDDVADEGQAGQHQVGRGVAPEARARAQPDDEPDQKRLGEMERVDRPRHDVVPLPVHAGERHAAVVVAEDLPVAVEEMPLQPDLRQLPMQPRPDHGAVGVDQEGQVQGEVGPLGHGPGLLPQDHDQEEDTPVAQKQDGPADQQRRAEEDEDQGVGRQPDVVDQQQRQDHRQVQGDQREAPAQLRIGQDGHAWTLRIDT